VNIIHSFIVAVVYLSLFVGRCGGDRVRSPGLVTRWYVDF
jgi:hypothetical protein